ncbi:MAG: hypothetical protein E7361_00285 [Clostridiales bacterium]|nr:hypothetical protein [Clostridiales bacterium]
MKKYSSYAFWVGLASAIVIFLEDIEALLGIDINTKLIESLILSFCGILIVLGIVVKDKKVDSVSKTNDTDDNNIEDEGE